MSEKMNPMVEEDARALDDAQLNEVAGGGQGGKKGRCPGCGSDRFVSLGGNKIRCTSCGWEGTKESIGL